MENKNPQNERVKYTGRFATEADSRPRRSAASARPRAAAAQAQTGHRPSGFAPAEPAKKRPAPRPAPAKAQKPEAPKREKPVRNKRDQGKKPGFSWKLPLIVAGALILIAIILVLIFGGRDKTYHQLPKVERGSSSAFTPEDTNAPEGTSAPEVSNETDAPEIEMSGINEGDLFDGASALEDASIFDDSFSFEDLQGLDGDSLFGDGSEIDGEELLNQLLALEGAGQ